MLEAGVTRGGAQKVSDWFQIPLCVLHHVGDEGVDSSMGVDEWERRYGRQLDHLRHVIDMLGVDVFAQAAAELPALPKIFRRQDGP